MDAIHSFLSLFQSVDLELVIRLVIQVVLLASSAFFSGSETALFSMSRLDLEKLRNTRNPHSDTIHGLLDEPRRLIISILCGNELVNIASSANMAAILVTYFGEADASWINIVVMVPLLLLVGEVTPKTIAVTYPIGFASLLSARLLPKWITLIGPLRAAVRFFADRLTTWIVGEPPDKQSLLGPDEFRTLVEEGEATGVIEATERVLIDNMLQASETEIVSIMTPRTRMNFIRIDTPMEEVVEMVKSYKHPRLPVTGRTKDQILGMLYCEDILRLVRSGRSLEGLKLENFIRKTVHFVPPTKKVDEMFDYFQKQNTRAAIILGEYGGVTGIVTMMDVLTFIFGEISGQLTDQEFTRDGDAFIVPGDMRLADFNHISNFNLEDPIMTTVGGIAFRYFDRLPQVGDRASSGGFTFTVIEMGNLRIKTLRVARGSGESAPAEESGAVTFTAQGAVVAPAPVPAPSPPSDPPQAVDAAEEPSPPSDPPQAAEVVPESTPPADPPQGAQAAIEGEMVTSKREDV